MSQRPLTNEFGQTIGSSLETWSPPPFPVREKMSGTFCQVEPLDPEKHAAELFESNSADKKGANWTYLPYGPFLEFVEYKKWLTKFCTNNDPQFYAVRDSSSQTATGLCSYLRITPEIGSIEVGHINYSPALKRTPAATEAMYLLMKNAFDLGYRRYEWKCDSLNAPSRAAAQRLGLSFEAVFRQATVYKCRNRDTAWFGAIDQDWPAIEGAFKTWLAPENFDETGNQRVSLRELTRPILHSIETDSA